MEFVLVKLDLEDQIVASVGILQSLILAQTLLVNVRRAMLLQPAASVMIITTEIQMELVKVYMSQMRYHKLSLINSDWQSMLACCMHYLNFLHIIILL